MPRRAVRRKRGERVVDALLTARTLVGGHGSGAPPTIIWDLDGTLCDPLPRMLATVRAFDRALDGVRLRDVRRSWLATARALRLDADRFFRFWREHYWSAVAFAHDTPIVPVLSRAQRAQALGLSNVVLTGRRVDTRGPTMAQLRALGFAPDELVMKPMGRVDTPTYKAAFVERLKSKPGARPVSLFVTDSVDEIRAVRTPWMRATAPELRCVLCRHPRDGQRLSSLPADAAVWPLDDGRVDGVIDRAVTRDHSRCR